MADGTDVSSCLAPRRTTHETTKRRRQALFVHCPIDVGLCKWSLATFVPLFYSAASALPSRYEKVIGYRWRVRSKIGATLKLPGKLRQGLVNESEDLRWRIGTGLLLLLVAATTAAAAAELLVAIKLRRFGLRNSWLRGVTGVLVSLPPPAPQTLPPAP